MTGLYETYAQRSNAKITYVKIPGTFCSVCIYGSSNLELNSLQYGMRSYWRVETGILFTNTHGKRGWL